MDKMMNLERIFESVLNEVKSFEKVTPESILAKLQNKGTCTIKIEDNPYDEFVLTTNESRTRVKCVNTYLYDCVDMYDEDKDDEYNAEAICKFNLSLRAIKNNLFNEEFGFDSDDKYYFTK